MKRVSLFLLVILCSCEQQFCPYIPNAKPSPIVFGLLDAHDSIHAIRLTKTFSGPDDANELAKDAANLLYDSVKMVVQCLDKSSNVVDSLTFHKVYFTPTSSGIFNTTKSWYYISTDRFPASDSYSFLRLKVWIYDTNEEFTSKKAYALREIERIKIYNPSRLSKTISVYNDKVTEINYSGMGSLGIKIRFNYSEVIDNVKYDKQIEDFWFISGTVYLTPAKLFMFIKNTLPDDSDVDYRVFNSLDILAYGAVSNIGYYQQLFNSDDGLFYTESFFETVNNDIINGYGIFCGYSKDSVLGLKFDQKTLDSLVDGQYTKELKFVRY